MTTGPTAWDGQGLPPGAQARIDRARSDRIRTSFIGVGGLTAIAHGDLGAAAFRPVGEVMGAIVEHIGWQGWGGCGYVSNYGGFAIPASMAGSTTTSGGPGGGYGGYRPYVEALYRGWDTALHRMMLEAGALGADGVVDVRWTWQPLDDHGNREFMALGTAVRSGSVHRPKQMFSTDLKASDVTKLLMSGHAPAGLAIGISVGVRHDDLATRQQSRFGAPNAEVSGYTELVNNVRNDARNQFQNRVARTGGEVAVVSNMALSISAMTQGENHRDHVAEATVTGTALVSSARAGVPSGSAARLAVFPLK